MNTDGQCMKTVENQKNSPYIKKIALKNTLKKEGGVCVCKVRYV